MLLSTIWSAELSAQQVEVKLVEDSENKKVDVLLGGQLFTSFIYPESLKKPVLWPVISPGGNRVTRSYPLVNKAGDRVDHPHHIGIWLNHGKVNGLDFWNNSNQISPEKRDRYGTIYHQTIEEVTSKNGKGKLRTTAHWKTPGNELLLKEQSTFLFTFTEGMRIIDRLTTLTAEAPTVTFSDSKEGLFGIRVCRELELPLEGKTRLLSESGEVIEVGHPDNTLVTGNYRNDTGLEGGGVWGTRSSWMKLSGNIDGETVSLIIIDHPGNQGYPTHWHARGYGLFAANPLGPSIFDKESQPLNFTLKQNESVTFKYRLVVAGSDLSDEQIEKLAENFSRTRF